MLKAMFLMDESRVNDGTNGPQHMPEISLPSHLSSLFRNVSQGIICKPKQKPTNKRPQVVWEAPMQKKNKKPHLLLHRSACLFGRGSGSSLLCLGVIL